ncbi:hypothetical protein JCM10213_008968 [Rhodosporidiobolus nylandii]
MPNTMAPAAIDGAFVNPARPAGHGEAAYKVGGDLPASVESPPASSPVDSRRPSLARGSSSSRDPFFRPGYEPNEERDNALRQVQAAQDASFAADMERAIRRSKRDQSMSRDRAGGEGEGERSASHHRGMSRIRAAIKDLVNDPFWHRPSKEEAAHQDDEMKRIILREIEAARVSTEAGDIDRACAKSRSRSHARSPLSSQPGSRSGSRVRGIFGGGGHKEESELPEPVKEE